MKHWIIETHRLSGTITMDCDWQEFLENYRILRKPSVLGPLFDVTDGDTGETVVTSGRLDPTYILNHTSYVALGIID